MLFTAYEFVFLFLPLTLIGYRWLDRRLGLHTAIAWLVLASLFFYAYWRPMYLLLLVPSVLVNYCIGLALVKLHKNQRHRSGKLLLGFGVFANLATIGYFKYANFFVDTVNQISDQSFSLEPILLPLAISFFTFQQIAYLVDAHRGETQEHSLLHYALFVVFFPQLIAGPIVHHKEMLPQFFRSDRSLASSDLILGLGIFALGMFKKVMIADNIATIADPIFRAAEQGEIITTVAAWCAALAYTAQLYFDFSGYSDMAIGLALMFGIHLPLNFNSPYKALNIIDFWRRWHMTLSRFLRDYLYIALGGNRGGNWKRYRNLFLTMLLGGLWHGAGWTFIIWGALHGAYLMINHAWQRTHQKLFGRDFSACWWYKGLAWCITFVAVVFAWVFFRAKDLASAVAMAKAMLGVNGTTLPPHWAKTLAPLKGPLETLGVQFVQTIGLVKISTPAWIVAALMLAVLAPNTQQIFQRPGAAPLPKWQRFFAFSPNIGWAWLIAAAFALALFARQSTTQFLYFNF